MNISEITAQFSGFRPNMLWSVRDCVFDALDREPSKRSASTVVYTPNARLAEMALHFCAMRRPAKYNIVQWNARESLTLRDEEGRRRRIFAYPLTRETVRGTASSDGTCVLVGVVNNPIAQRIVHELADIAHSHVYVILNEQEDVPLWYREAHDGPEAWMYEKMQQCSLSESTPEIFVMEV